MTDQAKIFNDPRSPLPPRAEGANPPLHGDVAEWLRSGLQIRVHRFDSGRRLHDLADLRTERLQVRLQFCSRNALFRV